MDRYVPFRAPSQLVLSLQAAAAERGVTVSRVIRDLLARGEAEDRSRRHDLPAKVL